MHSKLLHRCWALEIFLPACTMPAFFPQDCRKELERLSRTKVLATHLAKALTGFYCCVHGAIHEPSDDDLEGDLTGVFLLKNVSTIVEVCTFVMRLTVSNR